MGRLLRLVLLLVGLIMLAITAVIAIPRAAATIPPPAGLLFMSDRDGEARAYTMLFNGHGQHPTAQTIPERPDPTLSPDGLWRVTVEPDDRGTLRLVVADLDRREATRITGDAYDAAHPSWSPDGRWIAFISNRDGGFDTFGGLYRIRPDGSGFQRLTHLPVVGTTAAWSPDGRWIAFLVGSPAGMDTAIYRVNADGTDPHLLAASPRSDWHPVWLPPVAGTFRPAWVILVGTACLIATLRPSSA